MVKTNSMFIEIGTPLPPIKLINVNSDNQDIFNISNLDDRHLLIMFICAHCPFVKHVEEQLSKITINIKNKVQTIAISSNDILTYPGDSPENLREQAKINDWKFPYLFDAEQIFAKALKAACTPDFYLFSNIGENQFRLFYHGQLDKSRPTNNIKVSGEDLLKAVDDLEKYQEYQGLQIPSLGCNVKWKVGNEPDWFK